MKSWSELDFFIKWFYLEPKPTSKEFINGNVFMPVVFEVNNDLGVRLQNVVQNFCAWEYQWIICIVIWNVQRIQLSPPNNMKEKYYTTTYIFSEKIFNVGQPQSSAISTTSVWIFTPWQYFSSITFYALLFAFMKTICNNNNLLDTLILQYYSNPPPKKPYLFKCVQPISSCCWIQKFFIQGKIHEHQMFNL